MENFVGLHHVIFIPFDESALFAFPIRSTRTKVAARKNRETVMTKLMNYRTNLKTLNEALLNIIICQYCKYAWN